VLNLPEAACNPLATEFAAIRNHQASLTVCENGDPQPDPQ
jgi:hypothetical protein